MPLNFEELENTAPDWDPESDFDNNQEEQMREHYVMVGKSKIRQNLDLEMDPKYSGTKISRKELLDQEDESENVEMEDLASQTSDTSASKSDFDTESNESLNDSDKNSENEFESPEKDIKNDVLSKIKEHEAQEIELTTRLHHLAHKDAEKGVFVRKQLGIWDCLLEVRIRMQKAVEAANVLPPQHIFESLEDEELEAFMEETSRDICGVIDDLIDLKKALITDDQLKVSKTSLKRRRENDMEEWIDSTLNDIILPFEEAFSPYRNETIEKWNTKIQVANGVSLEKKFKVINQSIVSQIENSYNNREKLVKRTQLNRSNYQKIGSKKPSQEKEDGARDKHLNEYDEDIFDDGDYYQKLLKEFIDGRMNDTNDPTILAQRYAQLKQMQNKKSKKTIDTKASKGRKIRYQVHEKIQNFMTPEPRGTWHEEMIHELFSSLLGKQPIKNHIPNEIEMNDGFRLI